MLPVLPSLIALTETFLDAAVRPILTGYTHSRLPVEIETATPEASFCLHWTCLAPATAAVLSSEHAERVWTLVHSDSGPVLTACWYSPPSYGETVSIETLGTN